MRFAVQFEIHIELKLLHLSSFLSLCANDMCHTYAFSALAVSETPGYTCIAFYFQRNAFGYLHLIGTAAPNNTQTKKKKKKKKKKQF